MHRTVFGLLGVLKAGDRALLSKYITETEETDHIGLPLLWWSAPLSTFFWLVGSSGCLVGAHAGLLEPGVEA